jgi:hypothetical protein
VNNNRIVHIVVSRIPNHIRSVFYLQLNSVNNEHTTRKITRTTLSSSFFLCCFDIYFFKLSLDHIPFLHHPILIDDHVFLDRFDYFHNDLHHHHHYLMNIHSDYDLHIHLLLLHTLNLFHHIHLHVVSVNVDRLIGQISIERKRNLN